MTSQTKTQYKVLTRSLSLAAVALLLAGCGAGTTGTTSDASSAGTSSTSASTTATAETGSTETESGGTQATIDETTVAAEAFIATLSDEQKETLLYDYTDETKSTSWSNFPVTFVERSGLNLHDLTDEQKQAALKVLEGLLNDEAYAQVVNIMDGDQYLLDYSSTTEDSLGQYYIAFFGEPSDTSAWAIQFGGHHLGFNADLNGSADSITFAPTHLGSQPYSYTNSSGEEIITMDGIYTDAFAFYSSLTDEQAATVYQGTSVPNLSCAPGDTCDFSTGTGIVGSELTDEQKDMLLTLIKNYAGMADHQTWEAQKAKILATIDETYISWSGATEYDTSIDGGIYFLISGPNIYLEFSGQGSSIGADVEGRITAGWGHVHSIYRDPANDYGGSVEQSAATGMMDGEAPGAPGA